MRITNTKIDWLFFPLTKIIFSTIFVFGSGILGSALVAEITTSDGKIEWALITSKTSFKAIVFLIIISVIYQIIGSIDEKSYREEIDNGLLKQFIEQEGIKILASEVNRAIEQNDKGKLENLMDMKEILTQNLGKK
ncbi:MAG: hypothetical protein JKX79_12405 [Labilibaculum sp.]|nr:hypothetical protein [Labilibaculum sp.]